MNSLVTIIMPALNAETYISEAIVSVLNQTYPLWELIIVDNGSTDRTLQIAAQFKDERIRLFSENNKGTSHARNAGLAQARGEFICFLDADDLLPARSIRHRLDLFASNQTCEIADGKVNICDRLALHLKRTFQPSIPTDAKKEMAKLTPCCFTTVSWMIRSNAIKDHCFPFDWSHFEDRIFFGEIIRNGSYMCTQEVIYTYRRHQNSSMTSTDALDLAYQRFIKEIQPRYLSAAECKIEKKKYHSIFFRTYSKKLKFGKALFHFFKMLS